MDNKENQEMTRVEKTGGQTRWLAVTALFLTIGVILRLVSPNIAGITPNWLIAMYCLAILIVKPGWKKALGIGLVAGVVSVATSKAIFPYANLVSEPLGAVVCALIAGLPVRLPLIKHVMPAIATVASTLASGLVFITVTKLVMSIPLPVYLFGMLPVVLTVASVNCVVAQVLYYPAARLFAGKEVDPAKEEQK